MLPISPERSSCRMAVSYRGRMTNKVYVSGATMGVRSQFIPSMKDSADSLNYAQYTGAKTMLIHIAYGVRTRKPDCSDVLEKPSQPNSCGMATRHAELGISCSTERWYSRKTTAKSAFSSFTMATARSRMRSWKEWCSGMARPRPEITGPSMMIAKKNVTQLQPRE